MIKTYNTFIKAITNATNKAIRDAKYPYLQITETRTLKDKRHLRGILIESYHPDAPYSSAFYLDEAFISYLEKPYDIEEFTTKMLLQFLEDYNNITSEMAGGSI